MALSGGLFQQRNHVGQHQAKQAPVTMADDGIIVQPGFRQNKTSCPAIWREKWALQHI
jgi:hypothetical protein